MAAGEDDTPSTESTAESQLLNSTSDDTVEEIVRDFMLDSGNGMGDSSIPLSSFSGVNNASDYVGVSNWDYGADDPMRPQSSDPWAVQQFMTPGATYEFGLNTSDGAWSDISLSEFLKSPTPIPPVSLPAFCNLYPPRS